MKIAITGGSGFIGKWLLLALHKDFDVVVLGRQNVKTLKIGDNHFSYVSTDYTPETLIRALNGCDAVVHLAAKRFTENSQFRSYFDNIEISDNLFAACRQIHILNIVNLSSQSVYSEANQIPWLEDDIARPANFYGLSKITVENLAAYYNSQHGLKIKSLRAAQVLGWGEREGFMLMSFIKKAIKKDKLILFGSGAGKREYVYVKDLVDVIVRILKNNVADVYNIGLGINYSHREVAEMINDVFDNSGNLEVMPNKPEDKKIYLMNSDKIKEELSWQPKWSFCEALRDIKHTIQANTEKYFYENTF